MRIAALAHLQEKAPREATCPGRRGKVFFVSSLYVRVLQSARFGYRQTNGNEEQQIQNKQVDNSSQPGPKPNTTTRVRVLQPARFGYTGANGNEAHQIQNKQVGNSSLYETQPKTTRLQKRVSCGVVLMASAMLHEKCLKKNQCCNTVLQIGAPGLPMLTPVESNCFRNAPHNAMRTSQLPCPNNIQYKPGCSCLFQRFDWPKLDSLLVKASRKVRRGRNQHFAKWYHELPATHILSPALVVGTSTPSVHSFHHSFLSDHFNSTFLPSAASRRLKNMATVLDGGVQVRYHRFILPRVSNGQEKQERTYYISPLPCTSLCLETICFRAVA